MDLFHKPLPAAIQEPGPFAPDGFADQEGFLPRKGEGRGMKLNKFQIGNLSPRLISQGNPVAGGGVGICGTAVNPRQSTRGHDHGTGRENDVFPRIKIKSLDTINTPSVAQQPHYRRKFKGMDIFCFHHLLKEKTGQFLSRGIPAGMKDPAMAVPPFKAQQNVAISPPVKRHPHLNQILHPVAPLGNQYLDGIIITKSAPRNQGILNMSLKRIILVRNGCNSPLGKPGVAGIQLRLGNNGYIAETGRMKSGGKTGKSASYYYGVKFKLPHLQNMDFRQAKLTFPGRMTALICIPELHPDVHSPNTERIPRSFSAVKKWPTGISWGSNSSCCHVT